MSELEPRIREREFPNDIRRLRAQHEEVMAPVVGLFNPRLEGHILAYQAAVDALVETHRHLADGTDLDFEADSRWLALWEMSGRCLALANGLIDQLRRGYAAETIGTVRVLHEAANLLMVFIDQDDEALLRKWLAGDRVMPREARAHVESYEARVEEAARQEGLEIGGDMAGAMRLIYKILTKGAHNDRRGFVESIAREARVFTYGPHPDPRVRAVYVELAGGLIEQVVMEVGMAFRWIMGGTYYADYVRPLVESFQAVRMTLPIGEDVRAAYGYGEPG